MKTKQNRSSSSLNSLSFFSHLLTSLFSSHTFMLCNHLQIQAIVKKAFFLSLILIWISSSVLHSIFKTRPLSRNCGSEEEMWDFKEVIFLSLFWVFLPTKWDVQINADFAIFFNYNNALKILLYKIIWLTWCVLLCASKNTNDKRSKIISVQVDLWSIYTFCRVHVDQHYHLLLSTSLTQTEVKGKDYKAAVLLF